ncbi:uncharacterized protein LOC127968336 [Carassius gibelio]|uniref:uncharacterized protein LOC127968336 n=1 Tax=Carassius gibelio TaxID=101364 RepID=UPI002278A739|nr:uncharacterized protein LOC127968336 [Carassius gibelio]
MSKELQMSHQGHGGNDEDCAIPSTKHFHHGDDETDEENADIKEIDEAPIKISKAQDTSASASSEILSLIDTIDRKARTNADGGYAKQGFYASGFENEPGKRIPKAGYHAEAGVGRARAEYSVFEAEAKGPNASAGAEASLGGVGAMARAEIASASAKAGPVGVKVGLGFDTGASIGVDGVEAKFLGTGITIGPKTSISVLGSEASCSVM